MKLSSATGTKISARNDWDPSGRPVPSSAVQGNPRGGCFANLGRSHAVVRTILKSYRLYVSHVAPEAVSLGAQLAEFRAISLASGGVLLSPKWWGGSLLVPSRAHMRTSRTKHSASVPAEGIAEVVGDGGCCEV